MLAESKRLCKTLEQMLPHVHVPSNDAILITAAGQSVTVKIPTKLAAVGGSLSWRAYDFALLACDLLRQKRVVPGAVIARALMETTALIYLVHKKTEQALVQKNLAALDEFLIRCMSGNRLSENDPDSPNILTAIQALDKEPGCDKYVDCYSALSEFAHPNALGGFYAYSSYHDASRSMWFGRNRGLTRGGDIAFAVVFALEILIEFRTRALAKMPLVIELAKQTYSGG